MSQDSPGLVAQFARYVRLFAVEILALVLVLAWAFVGVPHVCGLFDAAAAPAFALGCALGLPVWVASRRFVRRHAGALTAVVVKSVLLLLMGSLVFVGAPLSHHLAGPALAAVAGVSGALVAAGTATVTLAWCTTLTSHASRDVEVVGTAALLANVVVAAVAAFVPQVSWGLVAGCPALAWALLVATRNEAMSRVGSAPTLTFSAALQPAASAPGGSKCAACRFSRGPAPLLVSLTLAYLALGFLGGLGPRGIESSPVELRILECLLTAALVLLVIALFRAHSARVDLPAALPWVTALVAAAFALRALGSAWALMAGSSLFTAAIALATFSTLTLVTGGFGASPRCACARIARPDAALVSVVGGYALGCVASGLPLLVEGTFAAPALVGAVLLLAAVSAYTAGTARRHA